MIVLMIILGFGVTIFVHELGHFLMARRAGVKVEVFSIGMGPRLLTLFKDKKGTDWILSAIPIGGYVKMLGQEDVPGNGVNKKVSGDSYQAKKPKQRLSIIMAGVTMNVIFAYILLVVAFTIGVPFTSNKIGGVLTGYPAEQAGFKPGDEILKVNDNLVESWEDFLAKISFAKVGSKMEVEVKRGEEILKIKTATTDTVTIDGEEIELPLPQLGLYPYVSPMIARENDQEKLEQIGLKAGQVIERFEVNGQVFKTARGIQRAITANPNKSYKMVVSEKGEMKELNGKIFSKELPKLGYQTLATISPQKGGSAFKAELKEGDVIEQINAQKMRGWEDVYNYCLTISSSEPINVIVLREGSRLLKIVYPIYHPENERYLVGIKPSSSAKASEISYVENWLTGIFNAPRVGDLLISFQREKSSSWKRIGDSKNDLDRYTYTYTREGVERKTSVLESLMEKEEVGKLVNFTYGEKIIKYSFHESLYKSINRGYKELQETYLFLTSLLKGQISPKLVGGPVKIFQVSYIVAESKGWGYFLLLFAKIGFSLAVINSLPIPVLDGGHAVFILYEMIRGKPAPPQFVFTMHQLGFIFLISLFIFVMYNDISSLFGG